MDWNALSWYQWMRGNEYGMEYLTTLEIDDEMDEYIEELKKEINLIESIRSTPDVALLRTGFYETLTGVLSFFTEPSTWYDPDFDPASLSANHPILIIPSGGLIGLSNSQIFRSKLEDYVSRGGTLIVFAQQNGYDYQVLPGGSVSGYGWAEDQ